MSLTINHQMSRDGVLTISATVDNTLVGAKMSIDTTCKRCGTRPGPGEAIKVVCQPNFDDGHIEHSGACPNQ